MEQTYNCMNAPWFSHLTAKTSKPLKTYLSLKKTPHL